MSSELAEHLVDAQELIGQSIVVAITPDSFTRNGFHTQMSIHGILEAKKEGCYRILVGDGTFVYFKAEDITLVNPLVHCADAVIYIKIDQREDS